MRVQPHLKKCFEGIAKLKFTEEQEVKGMISSEDEMVPFSKTVVPAEARVSGGGACIAVPSTSLLILLLPLNPSTSLLLFIYCMALSVSLSLPPSLSFSLSLFPSPHSLSPTLSGYGREMAAPSPTHNDTESKRRGSGGSECLSHHSS